MGWLSNVLTSRLGAIEAEYAAIAAERTAQQVAEQAYRTALVTSIQTGLRFKPAPVGCDTPVGYASSPQLRAEN